MFKISYGVKICYKRVNNEILVNVVECVVDVVERGPASLYYEFQYVIF